MATNTTPTEAAAAADVPPLATLEHLDPTTVVIEENIRHEVVELDPEFIDSIRAQGVLTPVSGRRADEGTVHIRYGQRRVLAAREVGLPTISVYLNVSGEAVADRVSAQLDENDRRAEMTTVERVDAFRMLELEGLSAARIAKVIGTRREAVKQALTVAGSEVAREAVAAQASLDVALALVEFEGDAEACATILAADEDELPWLTQRLRNDRAAAAAWQAAADEATANGITVLPRGSHEYSHLNSLTDAAADVDERPAVDAEQHTGCAGHRVRIDVRLSSGEATTTLVAVCVRPDLHHSRWGHRSAKVDLSALSEEE